MAIEQVMRVRKALRTVEEKEKKNWKNTLES